MSFRISQTFADYALQRLNEAPLVVVLALVESKRLLIAVSEQMKRLNINVGALQGAFQQRPEVFKTVSVNLSASVAFQVVDDLAVVILCRSS